MSGWARVAGTSLGAAGALVFLGWAVSWPALNRFLAGRFIMQLSTGLAFLVLGFGIIFARADRGFMEAVVSDGAAGFMARRLYPAVILLPILLGTLTLVGEEARLYNGKFGLVLLVLGSIVAFVVLVAL